MIKRRLYEAFDFDDSNEDGVDRIIGGNQRYSKAAKIREYIEKLYLRWYKEDYMYNRRLYGTSKWLAFNQFFEKIVKVPLFVAIDESYEDGYKISAWYDPEDSLEFDDFQYFAPYTKKVGIPKTMRELVDDILDYYTVNNSEIIDLLIEIFKDRKL